MIWTEALPYFPRHELACKGSGVIKLDARFAAMFPALRQQWGRPLTPSSVCRTPEHNLKERGHPRSLHLTDNPVHATHGTAAADLIWRDWDTDTKLAFARLAYSMGFSVGLHDGFCHVDLRTVAGLNQAVFVYGTWAAPFQAELIITGA